MFDSEKKMFKVEKRVGLFWELVLSSQTDLDTWGRQGNSWLLILS
jgi:hypothetical protein